MARQYIDEAICMDVDTDGDGNCSDLEDTPPGARRFFYCQDANYNVVALRESTHSGSPPSETITNTIVERYEYDPYGTVRVVRGWDSGGGHEAGCVAGQSLKWLDASLPSNPVLYCGYLHDWETGADGVRNRVLNSRLGRWMQTDPAKYVDGMNRYEYVRGKPVDRVDPLGLLSSPASQNCARCGPDITYQLNKMMIDIDYRFVKLDQAARAKFCGSPSDIDPSAPTMGGFIHPGGWDSDLHDKAYSFIIPGKCPQGRGCDKDPTPFPNEGGGSVTINGQCYGTFDVNYALFGRLVRLCDAEGRALLAMDVWLAKAPWERSRQKFGWYQWGYDWPGGAQLPSLPCFSNCSGCKDPWKKGIAWHASGGGVQLTSNGELQP